MKPGRNTPCPCASGKEIQVLLWPIAYRDFASVARVRVAFRIGSTGRVTRREAICGLGGTGPAVRYLPDCAPAYLNLGNAFARVGRSIEAEGNYQQALLLDPGLVQVHFNLGELYMERESFEQAATSFGRAIENHPGFAPAHANFGQACLRLGQYGKAEASCRRAVQLQPSSAAAHNSLGNVLSKLAPEEAIASYRTALALSPEFIEAWLNLANTLRGLGRSYEELVADTQRWTRAILEFLSLPWDPRCLEFQRTPRTIVTASKWQVRQPIDRGSVDRWRSYQQFLKPLLTLMPPTSV